MDHRPQRQDTFDLREHIVQDDVGNNMHLHADAASHHHQEHHEGEQRSVLDDDSDDGVVEGEDYIDDDEEGEGDGDTSGSSELSVPNELIDFDLVYSLHSFAATVEGQANVVKGDRLYLIDDSNSYWWLVRVLKTQEVGYIPAENIETPFERLARLNKHRNVDLASATQAEMQGDLDASHDTLRNKIANSRNGHPTPSPSPPKRGVQFTAAFSMHRYPPAVWNEDEIEEEDIEWDEGEYFGNDPDLAEDERTRNRGEPGMEDDDGMMWDDSATEEMQIQQRQAQARSQTLGIPDALQPAGGLTREQQQQQQLMMRQQQQQHQQQQAQQLAAQQHQQQQQQHELRTSGSRERLTTPDALRPGSVSPNVNRRLDPADVTETVRKTITPVVARSEEDGKHSPMEEERERERQKRIREEEEETARKRAKGKNGTTSPAPAPQKQPGGKLRKEPQNNTRERESEEDAKEKDKKKKSGIFGGIFGGRKKKQEKNTSISSFDSGAVDGNNVRDIRVSEDSSKSSRPSVASSGDRMVSPTTNLAIHQQQQQQLTRTSNSNDQKNSNPTTPERTPQVSQHASQLRQRDQEQQALYQEYLNRSPSSPPEAQPSLGLWSYSAVLGSSPGNTSGGSIGPSGSSGSGLGPPTTPRQRPGSLILTSSSMDGSGGPGVPELSVIRVFAGKNLQTEATFKTVLLNSSTTSSDLIRQAIQRFRLPGGDNQNDYYLTVKHVEGGSYAKLKEEEKPLVVFEELVRENGEKEEMEKMMMMQMIPKVKRSSVGSISSIASNLSMHPAITKLPMNDFMEDSKVKFYLNRRSDGARVGDEEEGDGSTEDGMIMDGVEEDVKDGHLIGDGDDTVLVDSPHGEDSEQSLTTPLKNQYLTVSTSGMNVTPERFSSPSVRFAVQLVLYHEDLPDNMVFHPTTEAIVFKKDLRESEVAMLDNPSVNPTLRKKVLLFPKNATVAEVLEVGLERFGVEEGVVDGGDEIEERKGGSRIRYAMWVRVGNEPERELMLTSRIIDAFPKPPLFRSPDRYSTGSGSLGIKRRSLDSVHLLNLNLSSGGTTGSGVEEVVQPDDPVFLLKRSVTYRNSTSRHRISAPLDELALQKLHNQMKREKERSKEREKERERRESMLSASTSGVSSGDEDTVRLHHVQQHQRHHQQQQHDQRQQHGRSGSGSGSNQLQQQQQLPPQQQQQQQQPQSKQQHKEPTRQPSAQEIITAQREATRANQRAILTAQSNSLRGTDVLLPGNVMLRSERYGYGDGNGEIERMRYSYVEADGETWDVSDIVESEWRGSRNEMRDEREEDDSDDDDDDNDDTVDHHTERDSNGDLLASVVRNAQEEGLGENLDRVLSRIRNGKPGSNVTPTIARTITPTGTGRGLIVEEDTDDEDEDDNLGGDLNVRESRYSMPSVSEYSVDDSIQGVSITGGLNALNASSRSRSATPGSAGLTSKMPGGSGPSSTNTYIATSSGSAEDRTRSPSVTIPAGRPTPTPADRRQLSFASVMSDSTSGYVTPPPYPPMMQESSSIHGTPRSGGAGSSMMSMNTSGSGTGSGRRKTPVIPKDDFGISSMMTIIECRAALAKVKDEEIERYRNGHGERGRRERERLKEKEKGLDVVDDLLLGRKIDLESLHPDVRGIFEHGFKLLEDADKMLDSYVQPSIGAF